MGGSKINCSHISRNLLHRLRDTPVEPGWVCQYTGARPALAWNHCWLCTTQPTAPGCWWLAGPGCKPGAPPNQISSWGSAVLRSSGGVFSPPWCSYPTSSWIAESQRRKAGVGLGSSASLPVPAPWHRLWREAWHARTHLRKLPHPQPCS